MLNKDDVAEAVIDAFQTPFASGAATITRLGNARDSIIHNYRAPQGTEVFLSLQDKETAGPSMYNNELTKIKRVYDQGRMYPTRAFHFGQTVSIAKAPHAREQ